MFISVKTHGNLLVVLESFSGGSSVCLTQPPQSKFALLFFLISGDKQEIFGSFVSMTVLLFTKILVLSVFTTMF